MVERCAFNRLPQVSHFRLARAAALTFARSRTTAELWAALMHVSEQKPFGEAPAETKSLW
jgi:hypothetical protein